MEEAKAVAISAVTPIEPLVYKSANKMPDQMLELQDYWKKTSLDSLDRFKEAHPKVPELARFMRENAYYSIPAGPVITHHIVMGKWEDMVQNPNAFEVVFMPPEYASQ